MYNVYYLFFNPVVVVKVLMKDITTPVPPNEVRAVIKKSLENAALVNYERLSEEARLEGKGSSASSFCFLLILLHFS